MVLLLAAAPRFVKVDSCTRPVLSTAWDVQCKDCGCREAVGR